MRHELREAKLRRRKHVLHVGSPYNIAMNSSLSWAASGSRKKTIMARQALTDEQHKAIRTYYYVTHRRSHDQRAVMPWFTRTFQQRISQPQVSIILSQQYSYLNSLRKSDDLCAKKHRSCKWPELKQALFTWQQAMQRRGACMSGLHLKGKALDFWSSLVIYKDLPVPLFSNGWLERFKHRRKICAWGRVVQW